MNQPVDLLGDPYNQATPDQMKVRHRGAYPADPGTGPEGKTCRDCKNYTRHQPYRSRKHYLKCARMQHCWTGGPGTDIKARTPACRFFEQKEEIK